MLMPEGIKHQYIALFHRLGLQGKRNFEGFVENKTAG